jgi:hypothetical protein
MSRDTHARRQALDMNKASNQGGCLFVIYINGTRYRIVAWEGG